MYNQIEGIIMISSIIAVIFTLVLFGTGIALIIINIPGAILLVFLSLWIGILTLMQAHQIDEYNRDKNKDHVKDE